MLDLLDEYIELRGWNRYRIDGRGGHGANQDEINEFNTAPFSNELRIFREQLRCAIGTGRR